MSKALLNGLKEEIGCECNVDDFLFEGDHTTSDNINRDYCICGKPILYKYSIKYIKTGKIIYPIGSECIKHFKLNEFNKLERFKKLNNSKVRGGKYRGKLISELYPRTLEWFYENCNSNKKYVKDIQEYYKLVYIDKIILYIK